MTIIETERMLLRFVEPSDLDALAAIYSDPEVGRFIGGPADRNETWDRIQRMRRFYRERRCGPYVALLKSTGEMIGRCGFLFWTVEGRDEVEIAYSLARRFWGQGLATEAVRSIARYGFDRMHFARMISLIHPDNKASIRVAEKAGMKLEKEVTIPNHGQRLMFAVSDG